MLKISFDTGKSNTKLSFYNKDSVVENMQYFSNVALNNSQIKTTKGAEEVYYNGNRYLIGEDGVNTFLENRSEVSKTNEVHKLLVLTGICKVLEAHNLTECDNVQIAVNCPLSVYKTVGEQDNVKEFYKNGGKPYEIKMNDNEYTFTITRVVPYFESIGPVILERKKFKDDEVITLDLGSLNTGYATFDALRPVGALSNNFNDGIEGLITTVEEILLKNDISNLTTANIQKVIKGTYKHVDSTTMAEVNAACINHVKQLRHKLFNRKLNLNLPILICGGGAELLERHLKETFDDVTIMANPLFANSDAGLQLMK